MLTKRLRYTNAPRKASSSAPRMASSYGPRKVSPSGSRKAMLCIALTALTAAIATAQAQPSQLLRDYDFIRQQDIWTTQTNPAALTRFSATNIVKAEAALTKADGALTDYYQSDNALQADICIESLYRLSQRTVFFGSISYNNWSGKNMTGSAFINPTRKPFNLVEDSLTNSGKKHRDTYQLTGGVGFDIYQGIAVGARIDYTSANYAKYKDLRHKNKLMDMTLTASIYAPLTAWLNVGADYQYHRQTESIEFNTYGKSDKVYKTLIDYGGFFGMVEQFGNEGYTDKTREMPLFEDGHGGHVQLEVVPAEGWSVFGSIGLSHGSGYYGRKSPYTITYTNHERNEFGTKVAVTCRRDDWQQRMTFGYDHEKVENQAETFRGLTNDNGATYYEYYDATETGGKRWKEVRVGYQADWRIRGELPVWSAAVEYQWGQRQQKAYLFPYYRQQTLERNEVRAAVTHNLITTKGVWTLMLQGGFAKGSGEPYEDGTFATPSSKQTAPATMETFLYREYQYLTAEQLMVGGKIKYAMMLPGTRLKTHASISISHRKASETNEYCDGKRHTELAVAIGCTF